MSGDQTKTILTAHLLRLLETRDYPKTICPSEVARAVTSDELATMDADGWQKLMPVIRELVWELKAGEMRELEVLQGGVVVDQGVALEDIKGPIRLRLGRVEGGA